MNRIQRGFTALIRAQNRTNDNQIKATIGGQSVDVVLGVIGTDQSNASGGYIDGATNTLQVSQLAFSTQPTQEQIVTIDGRSYDILSLALTGGIWTLTIGDHES